MTAQELQHQAEQFESYFRKDSVQEHVGKDFFNAFDTWSETKDFLPADELAIRSRAHRLLFQPRPAEKRALEEMLNRPGRAG